MCENGSIMYDIAIVGAGPAGTTVARLLESRYKILLIERRPLPDLSDNFSALKCCGGLLAPDAQMMLSKLGLGLPKSVLEDPQLFVVKSIDLQQGLERYYQRHYINMSRNKFDSWLLSLVPPLVDVRTGSRLLTFDAENKYFKLTIVHNKRTSVEKARILIGADGAGSKIRRRFSPSIPNPKKYLAIQEWVERRNDFPYFTSIFDQRITDFYCWTIPKGDYLIIGAALTPGKPALKKFELLKTKLKNIGMDIGKTVYREGTFIYRPIRQNQLFTGRKGIALLGEAAGWISPSSAEGISYAFKSALMLADSLAGSIDGFESRYQEKAEKLKRSIFLKNLKSKVIFNPTLRKMIMRWGIQSISVRRS